MDLKCLHCGEPWDLYYVLHEEPEAFTRKNGAIYKCPCCAENGKLTGEEAIKASALSEMADVLGDDIDGYASMLEDFDLN